MLKTANLALKFGLELAAVAAFAIWGATLGAGVVSILVAVLAPAIAIALWGVFAAPRSPRRLPASARIPFELAVFALAAAAFGAARSAVAAGAFGAAVLVNAGLMTAFGQWDA